MDIPWTRIMAHYHELSACKTAFKGLFAVSHYITESPLADDLYAWTNSADLCIAPRNLREEENAPFLRISPRNDGCLLFHYIDPLNQANDWQQMIPSHQAVAAFRLFKERLMSLQEHAVEHH